MNYLLLSTDEISDTTISESMPLLTLFILFLIFEFICFLIMIFSVRNIHKANRIIKGEISSSYYKEREEKFKLFSIDNQVASILCYLTFIPWLIAFHFCEDKESISAHLTRGLRLFILFIIPSFGITKIISIVKAIIHIKRIVSNGYYSDEDILWDWFNDYYSNPNLHIFFSVLFLIIAIAILCGIIYLFALEIKGIYV